MANYYIPFLLLLLLFLTILTHSTTPTTASWTPLPPPTAPPQEILLQQKERQQQLNNLIEALIGVGDLKSWINVLSLTDSSPLPLSATFFIPMDPEAIIANDPLLIPYHIVPQRLSFKDLRVFKPLSFLPTLLPNKYILITNNSASNFTLDSMLLSHPNLFITTNIAVHGTSGLLNYSLYGDPQHVRVIKPHPLLPWPLSPPPPPPAFVLPKGELIGGHHHRSEKTSVGFRLRVSEVRSLSSVFLILLGLLL